MLPCFQKWPFMSKARGIKSLAILTPCAFQGNTCGWLQSKEGFVQLVGHLMYTLWYYSKHIVSVPDPNQPQRGSLPEVICTGVGFKGLGPRLLKELWLHLQKKHQLHCDSKPHNFPTERVTSKADICWPTCSRVRCPTS